MNEWDVQNASVVRLSWAVALVVQAAARCHLLQFLPPFVQILRVFRIELRGTLGVYIFQIAFTAHISTTAQCRTKFSHEGAAFLLPFCA